MNIKSFEDIHARMLKIIDALTGDIQYPESYACLNFWLEEMNEFEEVGDFAIALASDLHETDATLPMHPLVARLVVNIYEDAIEEGNEDILCNLGSLYYTGRAGEQDYEKAAYFYDLADKVGNRQATENLGYIYYYGRTGHVDFEKSFNYFVKSAMDGNLRSMYKVGDFYRGGFYVGKDPIEAFAIYDHCAELITPELLDTVGADIYMRLADCYYEGAGVERDLFSAHRYMCTAENLFYQRLAAGDFYQRHNLEHVLERLTEIRKEIFEEKIPDFSWTNEDE